MGAIEVHHADTVVHVGGGWHRCQRIGSTLADGFEYRSRRLWPSFGKEGNLGNSGGDRKVLGTEGDDVASREARSLLNKGHPGRSLTSASPGYVRPKRRREKG